MKKIRYRGFSIEDEGDNLFAVRKHQRLAAGETITHDWKPWCESLQEAKEAVDKLIKSWGEMSDNERKAYYKLPGGKSDATRTRA
jgi:hypothetical protein